VLTAHHWRAIRLKLIQSGIADPMSLPNMHMALDMTEGAILEAFSLSQEKDSEHKKTMFLDSLYSPSADLVGVNKDGHVPQPRGFEADEVEASFDAFAAVAR